MIYRAENKRNEKQHKIVPNFRIKMQIWSQKKVENNERSCRFVRRNKLNERREQKRRDFRTRAYPCGFWIAKNRAAHIFAMQRHSSVRYRENAKIYVHNRKKSRVYIRHGWREKGGTILMRCGKIKLEKKSCMKKRT